MDWRRAKSVLIFSFLMLNVLLGYQLWTEWRERLNTAADWTSLPPETQQVMYEKNIGFDPDAKIPTETPIMRELNYTFTSLADSARDKPIPLANPPETRIVYFEKELKTALEGVIPDLELYAFDELGRTDKEFVFNRLENGYPIFDIRLELIYSDQRINGYLQDRIEILPPVNAKEQRVLPASKAVANLIERNLPAGSTIKEIKLGYQGQVFADAEMQVSSPAWRVLLENGEKYYVNAISAEVATEKGEAPVVAP